MSSIIKLKRSSTSGSVPGSLELGELAVNLFDRKLYIGNTTGVTAVGGEDFKLTTQDATAGTGAYIKLLGDSVLSSNSVLLAAGEGLDITRESNGTLTFAGEDASTSNKGIASFSSDNFSVSSGVVTIKDNGVALGTETTGNYVATITGTANEVEVSGSGSETAAVTIGLPNDVTIGNDLTVIGAASVGGNLTVDGNLQVEGAVTYLSTSTVYADDSMLKLAANNTGDTLDHGVYQLYVESATNKYSGYFRDATDGVYKFYTGVEAEPTTTVNTGATGYALAQVDAIIDGGTY